MTLKKTKLLFLMLVTLMSINAISQTNAKVAMQEMGWGFNLGNSWDNGWSVNTFSQLKPYIDAYVDQGAGHVRIPVTWISPWANGGVVMTNSSSNSWIQTLNSSSNNHLEELKLTITYCLDRGLYVILNTHHEEWLKDYYSQADYDSGMSSVLNQQFRKLWRLIAEEFEQEDYKLIFEVLNEPEARFGQDDGGGPWTSPNSVNGDWTRYINQVGYDAIRATGGNNRFRIIMVSPNGQAADQNIKLVWANTSELPGGGTDPYLAIQVHTYDPWNFAGQTGSSTYNSWEDLSAKIKGEIEQAVADAASLGDVALHYGEFGVGAQSPYRSQADRNNDRVRNWYRSIVETCLNNGVAATVWDDRGWFRLISDDAQSWTYNIVPYMIANVGGSTGGGSSNNSVAFTPPTTVTSGQTYNVTVNYQAAQSSQIDLQFFANGWNLLAAETNTVSAGSGTTNFSITIPAGTAVGNTYIWQTQIKPIGGDWTTRYDVADVQNVSVSAPTNNTTLPVVSFTQPATTTFNVGETITHVNVTATHSSGINNVALSFDGDPVRTEFGAPYDWWGSSENLLQNLTAGTHTLTATATAIDGSTATVTRTISVGSSNTNNCSATGTILMERYDGISGTTVADLTNSSNYPNNPSSSSQLTSFEIPTDVANNYGARVRGYLCAPETGIYYFWIAGDDNCVLNISSNDSPNNATLRAEVTGWTSSRLWNKYTTQKSAAIQLVQGETYYIEALIKEGGGGDNLAVGWRLPSQGNGTEPTQVIPGSVLSPASVTSTTASGFTLRNRWTSQYLYDAGTTVEYGESAINANYLWVTENVNGVNVRIKNVGTGNYMHIENRLGIVQMGTISSNMWSAQWLMENAIANDNTYIRISSRWYPDQDIHVENRNGSAQYGELPYWWYSSAHWIWASASINTTSQKSSSSSKDSETLSIETIDVLGSDDITLYPNPASSIITIKGAEKQSAVRIFNVNGVMMNNAVLNDSKQIDISNLNSGVYFIQVTESTKTKTLKLVKQ